MQVSELLTAGKAKIEQGWIRTVRARDDNGQEVDPMDKNACAFCSLGALVGSYFELDKGTKPEPYLNTDPINKSDTYVDGANWLCGAEKSPVFNDAVKALSTAMLQVMSGKLYCYEALKRLQGSYGHETVVWGVNDSAEIEKADVVSAFDAAIKLAKEQENGTSTGQDTGSVGEGTGSTD